MRHIALQRCLHGVAILSACLLGGCRVMSVAESRAIEARRGGNLDASAYVANLWNSKAMPAIASAAVPLDTLAPAIAKTLDQAGAAHGRRVSEGSAWTFVMRGTARVAAVDTRSRRGTVEIELPGAAPGEPARLQVGPVVEGTAIRDALPFVAFNDFADQLAYADIGRALTTRALTGVRPVVGRLRAGQRISFVGVANVRDPGQPLLITPVSIAIDDAR